MICIKCQFSPVGWPEYPGNVCFKCISNWIKEQTTELSNKLQNLIQQRKSQITQEITLLKEILAHE